MALATQLESWEKAEQEGRREGGDGIGRSSTFGLQSVVWSCFGVLTLVHVYANWKGVSKTRERELRIYFLRPLFALPLLYLMAPFELLRWLGSHPIHVLVYIG